MRMAGAVAAGTIIIQVLLAAAFVLGFFWLGGWQWGLLFAGIMLLLIVLPWLGDLKVVIDSDGPRGTVRIGWWGRVAFRVAATETRLLIRVLGIPIRRTMTSDKPAEPRKSDKAEKTEKDAAEPVTGSPAGGTAAGDPPPEPEVARPEPEEKKPHMKAYDRLRKLRLPDARTVENFSRIAGAALNAGNDFVWGADEIIVCVSDPVQSKLPDAALQEIIGSRAVGPVHLSVSSPGNGRRVRALYRIGLLRAVLAGVQMVIDGRAIEFAREMSAGSGRAAKEDVDEYDRKLIDEIIAQREEES